MPHASQLVIAQKIAAAENITPAQRLPNELNTMVLHQVSDVSTLVNLARVNSEFQLEVEPSIYKSIVITEEWLNASRRLHLLQSTLSTCPRRRALVASVDYKFDDIFLDSNQWIDSVGFFLSKLPNLKTLGIPSFDVPEEDSYVFFTAQSRLEKLLVYSFDPFPHLIQFYATQSELRQICYLVCGREAEDHDPLPPIVLPVLESVHCKAEMLELYVPGRPIKDIGAFMGEQGMDIILPVLRRSTSTITRLRLEEFEFTYSELGVIVTALPSLQVLELDVTSETTEDWDDRWPSDTSPSFEFSTHLSVPIPFPHFTLDFVNTFFQPLSSLRDLRSFLFKYTWGPKGVFTNYDITSALGWKDAPTCHLEYARFHCIELLRTANGRWEQRQVAEGDYHGDYPGLN